MLLEMLPALSDRARVLIALNAPRSEEMDPEAALRGLRGHQRILESLRARDRAAAAQAPHRELTSGKEQLLKRMGEL